MSRNKYYFIGALILIIAALLVRQRFFLNTNPAPVVPSKTVSEKSDFGIVLDERIFTDAGEDITEQVQEEKKPTQTAPPVPENGITSEAYVVGNLITGEIYMSRRPDSVFPIASVSKLYTSLIVRHVMDPLIKVLITQTALDTHGDAGHLVLGELFTQDELLYPLVLESSNDAAVAFAETYGYAEFVTQMNAFAKEIGMTRTSFRDASGLSPGNISSARDLLAFSGYLFQYEKPLLEITRTREYELSTTTDHGSHLFRSINPFTLNPYFIGGKTGRTNEAGESMVSLFHFEAQGKTYPVGIIVLRSRWGEREADTRKLLEQFMKSIGAENVTTVN